VNFTTSKLLQAITKFPELTNKIMTSVTTFYTPLKITFRAHKAAADFKFFGFLPLIFILI